MYRVLIAEDMEGIRLQLKRLFLWGEASGFEIAGMARDGQEALDLLDREAFDLILSDIRMPRIDGLELLQEAKRRNPGQLVLFLSDHGEFEIARAALRLGVKDYLLKPVNPKELAELLAGIKAELDERQQEASGFPEARILSIAAQLRLGNEEAVALAEGLQKSLVEDGQRSPEDLGILWERIIASLNQEILKEHPWLSDFEDAWDPRETLSEYVRRIQQRIRAFFPGEAAGPYVRKVCMEILTGLGKDLSMEDLAASLFLSKNYLGELFREEAGQTVSAYKAFVKVERSKYLLRHSSLRWYEIANELGYSNIEYFTKVFKKIQGETPQEYRNRNLYGKLP